MSTKKIAFENVTFARYLSTYVFDHGSPVTAGSTIDKQKLEVYTGWIGVNVGSSNLEHVEIISFLPNDKNHVWDYMNLDPNANVFSGGLDVTVTAAPSSVQQSDGFDGIAAVDFATVTVEKQTQGVPGVTGIPNCLVLRARIGTTHANVFAITYQVTVLTKVLEVHSVPSQAPRTIVIPGNFVPR